MPIQIKEIRTELSAFDIYTIFKEDDCIFLDSSKHQTELGRYSIIGLKPNKRLVYEKGILREDGKNIEGEPFEVLGQRIRTYSEPNTTELPIVGGCIGYFSYDLGWVLEKLPDINPSLVTVPDMYFVFYDLLIIVDHYMGRTYITEHMRSTVQVSRTEEMESLIVSGTANKVRKLKYEAVTFTSAYTKSAYMNAVNEMRSFIREGDIYIANMTHTFNAKTDREGFDIYNVLRHLNPAPFAAYMPLDGFEVLCSSPERFIRIKDMVVETRPIKGTRPRGKTPEEDEANAQELRDSEKDKSELLMVVDLERNDLSKICEPHTVEVTELFEIESYATVHHLVSTIVGRLAEGKDSVDCMKACFPGGSITGTPKIRAMEVIELLEMSKRNIYTGCIGYFGYDGSADFNIVIRTILKKENQLFIGVGGGITWESDAEAEYMETLDKAEALFRAVSTMEVAEDEITD